MKQHVKFIDLCPSTYLEFTGLAYPSAYFEVEPLALRMNDWIGDLRLTSDVKEATHNDQLGVLVNVIAPPYTEHDCHGRLVLQLKSLLRIKRLFDSDTERDEFIRNLQLPEGCEFKMARLLMPHEVIVHKGTYMQITKLELRANASHAQDFSVVVAVEALADNDAEFKINFFPEQEIIVCTTRVGTLKHNGPEGPVTFWDGSKWTPMKSAAEHHAVLKDVLLEAKLKASGL